MPSRSWIRWLAAVGGLVLLLAAVAHEKAAEHCLEAGGRWQPGHLACGARSARDVQGIALRRAIDEEFRHRRDDRLLHGPGGDRNVISPVVEASIPLGTPLDTAASVLRAAGFKVQSRGPCDVAGVHGQCLQARIDDYAFALFGSTAIQVQLEGEGDHAAVHTVSAEIVVERMM